MWKIQLKTCQYVYTGRQAANNVQFSHSITTSRTVVAVLGKARLITVRSSMVRLFTWSSIFILVILDLLRYLFQFKYKERNKPCSLFYCWSMVSSSISLSPLARPSKARSCEVTGLLPFTEYYCEIQPRFNDKPIGTATNKQSKTSTGGELL